MKSVIRLSEQKEPFYKRKTFQLYMFLLFAIVPSFTAYVVFALYPNILSVYYSFLDWDGLKEKAFIGWQNYIDLLHDPFIGRALLHNLIMVVTAIPLTLIIALFLADLLVNRNFRENGFYKVVYFLPNVLSGVVVSLMWMFVYDGTFGLINSILGAVGLPADTNWLGNPKTALGCIIAMSVWCSVGFYVVIFINAMRSIPSSLYESAKLEGITQFQRLRKITLPLMAGTIRIAMIYMAIGSIQGYGNILIMTQGGPAGATDVIGLYMFNFAFGKLNLGSKNYGYASAIGMLIFVVLVAVKLLVDRFSKKDAYEY